MQAQTGLDSHPASRIPLALGPRDCTLSQNVNRFFRHFHALHLRFNEDITAHQIESVSVTWAVSHGPNLVMGHGTSAFYVVIESNLSREIERRGDAWVIISRTVGSLPQLPPLFEVKQTPAVPDAKSKMKDRLTKLSFSRDRSES